MESLGVSKPRILVTSKHPGDAIDALSNQVALDVHCSFEPMNHHELCEHLKECDGVICVLADHITEYVMSLCPRLKMIANVAVGYDNIDIEAATKYGILVTNTPGVLDETTADLAFGLLLACARRIAEGDRFIRQDKWNSWRCDLMLGVDVFGKTLGIVGYGRIGQAMARRAQGFAMQVLYCRSQPPSSSELETTSHPRHVSLDELLESSDFISIHCPLNKHTHHLIGKRELSLVKPESILINTSRGAVVDETALVEALKKGRLRGVALDVFEQEPCVPVELKTMDGVVLTPHIGSASVETRSAMARLAVDALMCAFAGQMPPHVVNQETWRSFAERSRGCLITNQ
ncbi:MAG: D-glycerate dehydrogenase [Candidatus Melainabacteria bacterium]|nr:D-glycerate dehydrogenase [Candidatus Melainabacteria bacterium]